MEQQGFFEDMCWNVFKTAEAKVPLLQHSGNTRPAHILIWNNSKCPALSVQAILSGSQSARKSRVNIIKYLWIFIRPPPIEPLHVVNSWARTSLMKRRSATSLPGWSPAKPQWLEIWRNQARGIKAARCTWLYLLQKIGLEKASIFRAESDFCEV